MYSKTEIRRHRELTTSSIANSELQAKCKSGIFEYDKSACDGENEKASASSTFSLFKSSCSSSARCCGIYESEVFFTHLKQREIITIKMGEISRGFEKDGSNRF